MALGLLENIIQKRYSALAFSEKELEKETLLRLFEAARWAASCFNEQPWRFVFALRKNTADFERILSCLVPDNQAWAKTASLLMITAARSAFAYNGKTNSHAWHDLGQAISQFALQATELGLSLHQMAGFDAKKAKRELNIPDPFEPVAAAALGYPGEIKNLEAGLKERAMSPRVRKDLNEIVFEASWGKGLS